MKKETSTSAILDRVLSWIAPGLMGLTYVFVGLYNLGVHLYPGETDTSAFFAYVAEIVRHGGILETLKSLFTGDFTLSNQHPLFPFFITFFFERSMNYFVWVKILNFILGLVFVLMIYVMIRRECNEIYALVVMGLVIANDVFMHQTTMVSCEPLLIVFSTITFYFLIKGLDDNRCWIPAGIFAGLTYMTKASGLFILFGFSLFLLYDCRLRITRLLKNRYLWGFIICFIVVSLPLLVRNTLVYKFPFYNYNVRILAMDEDWGKAEKHAQFKDILKKDIGENSLRFIKGLGKEFRVLLHSLYPFSIHYVPPFSEDNAGIVRKITAAVLSMLMFGLSVLGFIKSKTGKRKKSLIVFLITGFYLPLSWYSITSPNRRYIMPVMFFFLIFFSIILVRSWYRLYEKSAVIKGGSASLSPASSIKIIIFIFLLLFNGIYLYARHIPDPRRTWKLEDDYHELAAFFKSHLKAGELYMTRGEHHYPWVLLYPELNGKMCGITYFKNLKAFVDFTRSHAQVKYFLMQPEAYRQTKNIFSEYLSFDYTRGFIVKSDIPGWRIIKKDELPPVQYLLYERQ